ncbi:hypothetical protein TL16_g06832 [Triparma laevis f. inornata]|uniref:Kinesin light chain n=1 Tax=Triparma laevis f. inornata TaxID=1714386 RepID=A0A9W7EEC4_9STRA|nr:hypothetical protein TL16_g06832 [Triparma laevis f. inornata]
MLDSVKTFVKSLHPSNLHGLKNVLGLVAVREKAVDIDEREMKGGLMKKFASFQRTVGDPIQDAPHTITLSELYKQAKSIQPTFKSLVKKISKKAGITPNLKPKINGSKLKRNDHTNKSYKSLTLPPLKNIARMLETLNNYSVLGNAAFDQNQYLLALTHFGHAKDGFEGHFGIDDEKTLAMAGSIAMCHHVLGRFDCAIEMFKYVLGKQESLVGRDDENVLATVNNLAVAHEEKGEYVEARVLREWCLESRKKALGNEHPLTVKALSCLAQVAQLSKNYTLARDMFKQSLKKMGNYNDAVLFYERGIEGLKMKFGKDHQVVLRNAKNFRTCLRNMGHEGVCRMGELEEEFPDLDIKWHRCNCCDFKAKEKEKLSRHLVKDFSWARCDHCEYKTKTQAGLKKHKDRRHK